MLSRDRPSQQCSFWSVYSVSIELTAHSVLTFYMTNHFNTNPKLFSSCVDVMRTTARKKIRDKFIIALQLQKKTSNSILRYFKKGKKNIGKCNTISNTHKTSSHSWLAKSGLFFFLSFSGQLLYTFFCYCCPRLIWFIRMRKCGNFSSSQQHNKHTSLLLLWDFFVVSQWRSFIKWQRIFRFLAELFKGSVF